MSALPPLLLRGDCLHELKLIPDTSVDAVVTDPPYGLANTDPAHVVEALTRWARGERDFIPTGRGFMGKAWDAFVPPPAVWDECARILKPGGHLLAFAGSRTFDLMTLSIRFAGFDIRDSIAWLYGSGFPKSMDVSKAIDKAAATPATAAREWEGWGTALKPAFEPIIVARKPFPGTVAANVLAHGTGALNINATRIGSEERVNRGMSSLGVMHDDDWKPREVSSVVAGRWPANVVLDESQADALDEQSGTKMSRGNTPARRKGATGDAAYGLGHGGQDSVTEWHAEESGGASRFFYVAKAPKSERPVVDGTAHPTVKPLALMQWLLRLVTPPRGVIVDPFAGSGATLEAAYLEDFDAIGVEMTPDYWPLIEARIARVRS